MKSFTVEFNIAGGGSLQVAATDSEEAREMFENMPSETILDYSDFDFEVTAVTCDDDDG